METLYRKVAVSDRLPRTENLIYSTDKGDLFFKDKRFHSKDGLLITKVSTVNHWLEEIPDPTAQLQADKAELLEALVNCKKVIKQRCNMGIIELDNLIKKT